MSTRNPTGPPALNNPRVSERFSDTDADITIQASDGTLFRVHTMNLRATTEGLSPPPCATLDQVVQLTEDSATLDLLFQFMYPSRHPDLEDVHFNLLEHVAEAAEKYQVYPAMNMCKVRMKNQLSQYPDAVMLYAMRHGYPEIMDKAAPRVIAQTLYKTVAKMPPRYIVPWIQYHSYWLYVAQNALSYYPNSVPSTTLRPTRPPLSSEINDSTTALALRHQYALTSSGGFWDLSTNGLLCRTCGPLAEQRVIEVMARLGGNVTALRNLSSTFSIEGLASCTFCTTWFRTWQKGVEAEIGRIPIFSAFCT